MLLHVHEFPITSSDTTRITAHKQTHYTNICTKTYVIIHSKYNISYFKLTVLSSIRYISYHFNSNNIFLIIQLSFLTDVVAYIMEISLLLIVEMYSNKLPSNSNANHVAEH